MRVLGTAVAIGGINASNIQRDVVWGSTPYLQFDVAKIHTRNTINSRVAGDGVLED